MRLFGVFLGQLGSNKTCFVSSASKKINFYHYYPTKKEQTQGQCSGLRLFLCLCMHMYTQIYSRYAHMHAQTLCGTRHCCEVSVLQLLQFESPYNLELTKHCTDQIKLSIPTEGDAMVPMGVIPRGAGSP